MGYTFKDNFTKEYLKEALDCSYNLKECVVYLYGDDFPKYRARLYRQAVYHKLEKEYLEIRRQSNLNINMSKCIEDILEGKITADQSTLKRKLIEAKIIKLECKLCGQLPEWMGSILTLQLDHIDGNSKNNELTNLRLLCPNCHSQTPTYCRGNKLSSMQPCIKCNLTLTRSSTCSECHFNQFKAKLIHKLSKKELIFLTETYSVGELIESFNSSYRVIKRIMNQLGITCKPKGYWCTIRRMYGPANMTYIKELVERISKEDL